MHRLLHLGGAYALSGDGQIGDGTRLSADEESALEREHVETPSALALQQLRSRVDRDALRARNIAITKLQIRESVTGDAHIIHAITTIDEIDRVANTLAKRLRDWAALENPELEHAQRDHRAFVRALLESKAPGEGSMGARFSAEDKDALRTQCAALEQLYAQRDRLLEYLEARMREHTPNLLRVAGAPVGAKLLALAGSLKRIARMPSGTVQLLGAETALFRHLRNRSARPPKHGVIFNHPLLQRAPRERRGKAARAIADAITIAARVDHFKGEFVGEQLVERMERCVRQ
jgi:nucleolar protein 56